MRQQDHFRALAGNLPDRRQDAVDARRVGDAAIFHRDVEVDAQQHALAGEIGLIEGLESSHDDIRRGSG